MNKSKNIEESILLAILQAIESIKEGIANTSDIDENRSRSEAIKVLSEAYDIVRRGRSGDFHE